MDNYSGRHSTRQKLAGNFRRILIVTATVALLLLFFIWQLENERMERVRVTIVDTLHPITEFGHKPLILLNGVIQNISKHMDLVDRTTELENEVNALKYLREQVELLENQNAELRKLLNAPKRPVQREMSAMVVADTSSQFRHSILVNVGSENGVKNGWPVVDSMGLAGRILGVGRKNSRVLLLVDASSRVPIKIVGGNARGVAIGDGTPSPKLQFVPAANLTLGSRVVTSGDGGVFPPDIIVGEIVLGKDRIPRVRLFANLSNLTYVSLLRVDNREISPFDVGIITTPSTNSEEIQSGF